MPFTTETQEEISEGVLCQSLTELITATLSVRRVNKQYFSFDIILCFFRRVLPDFMWKVQLLLIPSGGPGKKRLHLLLMAPIIHRCWKPYP